MKKILLPYHRLLLMVIFLCLTADNLLACGWWGDGESLMDDESITVDGNGRIIQNNTLDDESPEALTQRANKLRHYGQSGFVGATRLYRQAAKKGYAPAQNNLGEMYVKGQGVASNLNYAAELFRLAALQGEAHAQHSLGIMLIKGKGILPDVTKGLQWIEKSAEADHISASIDLIKLYSDGIYVKKNQNKANYWRKKIDDIEKTKDSIDNVFENE